jgi:hypothetical protein
VIDFHYVKVLEEEQYMELAPQDVPTWKKLRGKRHIAISILHAARCRRCSATWPIYRNVRVGSEKCNSIGSERWAVLAVTQ